MKFIRFAVLAALMTLPMARPSLAQFTVRDGNGALQRACEVTDSTGIYHSCYVAEAISAGLPIQLYAEADHSLDVTIKTSPDLTAAQLTAAGLALHSDMTFLNAVLGSPMQAGGYIGNSYFLEDCMVVSADQGFTVGTQQHCTMTTTGRIKVGLSSAATIGQVASTTADLAGAIDPSGNQQGLHQDGSFNLKTVEANSAAGLIAAQAAKADLDALVAAPPLTNAQLNAAALATAAGQATAHTDAVAIAAKQPTSPALETGNLAAAASSTATTASNTGSTATNTGAIATDIGPPGATACTTDTGSCSINAEIQRTNQRITALITAIGSPMQAGGSFGNTGFTVTQSGSWSFNCTSGCGGSGGIGTTTAPNIMGGSANTADTQGTGPAGANSANVFLGGVYAGLSLGANLQLNGTAACALSAASASSTSCVPAVGLIGNLAYADTTTALGASSAFTGTSRTVPVWATYFNVTFYADQVSGTNGAEIDCSPDNSTWTVEATATLAASTSTILSVPIMCVYQRVKETNGATAQGTNRVSSSFTGG